VTERLDELIRDIHRVSGGTPPEPPPRPRRSPQPSRNDLRPPARARRSRRGWWIALSLLVTGALVAATVVLVETQRPEGGSPEAPAGGWAPEQQVFSWAIWDPQAEEVGLAVVLADGGLPPLALAIPWYTQASVPGYGLDLLGEAVDLRSPDVAAATVENLLGVQVDASAGSTLVDLAGLVDRLGGIEVENHTVHGEAFLSYIRRTVGDEETEGELRFIRWLEAIGGILQAAEGNPAALTGLPPGVAEGLAAAAGTDVVTFPVESIGSGLAAPMAEQVEGLVADRFVSSAETDARLVVLNGNGSLGVGEQVARLLVPAGFELVSSLNAPTFDEEETKIVAADEGFLDEAELARELLGVGQVVLGEQPTGVADVTVLVGQDFGGS